MGQQDFVYVGAAAGSAGGAGIQIAGNTVGTTALVNSGTLTLAGGNNITLSQSGNAITISAPNTASQTAATYSQWAPFGLGALTGNNSFGQSTLFMMPAQLMGYLSASVVNAYVSASVSTSSNSSHQGSLSFLVGIYTLSNSSTLNLASSGSQSWSWNVTGSTSSDSLVGVRQIQIPLTASMTPGEYWIGCLSKTASANANWVTISNGIVNAARITSAFASNVGVRPMAGMGRFSVQTAALPATVKLTEINTQGANIDNEPAILQFVNLS